MSTPTRVQRRAARLDDPRFESIRTPRVRRRLVVAMCGLLVAEAGLFFLAERTPVLFAIGLSALLVAFVLCLGALKGSTRGVEELPAEALDERQWQLRGEAYARAYRIGFGLLGDYDALPDLDAVADDLEASIDELAEAAGLPAGSPKPGRPRRKKAATT